MHSWHRGSDETAQPHHTKEGLSGSSASFFQVRLSYHRRKCLWDIIPCIVGAALGGGSPISLLSLAGKNAPAAALDQCQSCGAPDGHLLCESGNTSHWDNKITEISLSIASLCLPAACWRC